MLSFKTVANVLRVAFGSDWDNLTAAERAAVLPDFREMAREEYDVPDDTMSDNIAEENLLEAAIEYRRRIGRSNLQAYAKTMQAKLGRGGAA